MDLQERDKNGEGYPMSKPTYNTHICIYVCMCMYVRMYVCVYVCMYVCMYVRTYVCMCHDGHKFEINPQLGNVTDLAS